jgi:hypothetical protein
MAMVAECPMAEVSKELLGGVKPPMEFKVVFWFSTEALS